MWILERKKKRETAHRVSLLGKKEKRKREEPGAGEDSRPVLSWKRKRGEKSRGLLLVKKKKKEREDAQSFLHFIFEKRGRKEKDATAKVPLP